MRRLVLYGRPECHLCDEARELLLPSSSREAGDVELERADIEEDDELLARFLERIPVLELDGDVIGELVPGPAALRATLLNTPAR